MKLFYSLYILLSLFSFMQCQLLEGLYCGKENCYDVLGVNRDSNKNDIARNYRQLARKFHPDTHRSAEAKSEAEERFKIIATAYEILKDEEARNDYNYMLDNPEEYYAHYYRYYRRRMAPKVDVRIVLAITISVISGVQYYFAWQRYEDAIKYFVTIPKYRNQAMEIAKEEIGDILNKKKDGNRKVSKSEQKEELEKLIRSVIEDKMDIKGSYAKPSITDILWIQLILFPYSLGKYLLWYARWVWRHNIKKLPYGEEEKLYIIRKNMGMGVHQFNSLEDSTLRQYLKEELWLRDNFTEWKKRQEEDMKKQLAENNKYKQYRRYLRNHGPGRITFDDS